MNDNKKDIRWRQRFENLHSMIKHLSDAIKINNPTTVQKAGMIQFFEVAFELSWKTIKDYLESIGYNEKGPRPILKKAFELDIINNGEVWMRALEDRNLTAHIYNDEKTNEIFNKINKEYYPIMEELDEYFSQRCE